MTKEQVILAYQKKYGHIPDLLARIVTQLDYTHPEDIKAIDSRNFGLWKDTAEGYLFWSDVYAADHKGILSKDWFDQKIKGLPGAPLNEAKSIIELAERKQVFEALKTLVELDFTDGGSRVLGSNEITDTCVMYAADMISTTMPHGTIESLEAGTKRALILIVDAAEYDKVDNDGL